MKVPWLQVSMIQAPTPDPKSPIPETFSHATPGINSGWHGEIHASVVLHGGVSRFATARKDEEWECMVVSRAS